MANKKIQPPKIDWLKGAVMVRKQQLKLSNEDLGVLTGMHGGSIERLLRETDSWNWTPKAREGICKALCITDTELQTAALLSMTGK